MTAIGRKEKGTELCETFLSFESDDEKVQMPKVLNLSARANRTKAIWYL